MIKYIHIPKTAGTSITTLIKPINVNKKYYKNKNDIVISCYHKPLKYFDETEIKKILDKVTLFAVVRNPYDRIISDFNFWIKIYERHFTKKNIHKNKRYLLNQFNLLLSGDVQSNDERLNTYIHNVLSKPDLHNWMDSHLIPMHEYVVFDNKLIINDLIYFEHLNKEFNMLIKKHNLKIPLDKLNKCKLNKTHGQLSIKNLDKQSIELINKIYHYDFVYFNYKKIE